MLTGYRAGDNAQTLALAEALGWPFSVKRFRYRRSELLTNLLFGATLAGTHKAGSSTLEPPWPDLVITAGRRNEPVARWIKANSGGQARLVHLGRPWADIRRFDLVITTPQYFLPARDNVVVIAMPLHQITPAGLAAAAAAWERPLAHLPRPWTAALVGGDSPPYRLGAGEARRLATMLQTEAAQCGGSVLVTTSARTRPEAVRALREGITAPCHFHEWQAGAATNPYLAYLALADAIVVTGDSLSMLTEACATGKPVYVFDIGQGPTAMRETAPTRWDLRSLPYRTMMRLAPRRMRRDIRVLLRGAVASGRAAWLGTDGLFAARPADGDLARAVAAVKVLFEPDRRSSPFATRP